MQAVRAQLCVHRLIGRHQTLRHHLAPEEALLRHQTIADESEVRGLAWRNLLEHFGKTAHGASL